MFTIYIDSPVPSVKDIKEDFLNQLKTIQDEIPNFQDFIDEISSTSFPSVLGLPEPMFSGYTNTLQELMEVTDAVKYQADTLTMMNLFNPLASVIGSSLEDILPKIPVLDTSIVDIVSGNTQELYDAITDYLQDGIELPYLPSEMFETFSNTAKEALLSLKIILVGYKELLLTTMQDMIKEVMKILGISGVIPTLPIIPTIDQLKQTVLVAFPDYASWSELITNADVSDIIGIFGLNSSILSESSFIPNYSNYEQYILESFNQIKDYYSSLGLKMLVDFAEKNLGVLGFKFPSFYIRF